MASVRSHENIRLLSYSEVKEVSGYIGNFKVKVNRKARYIDESKCTGCSECSKYCPVEVVSEFDEGLSKRKAIYIPFAQAVPNKATIDKRGERACHAACVDACPLGANVLGYLKLIADGKFAEAYRLIRETNPFPAVCGHVCYAPCEDACNRGQLDQPLAIRGLKRFAVDRGGQDQFEIPPIQKTGQKVAIIGAGPAGLSAADYLALKGHQVTVFDALPEAGGMMRVAIDDDRLPRDLLDRDIKHIQKLGVDIKLNRKIDSLDFLFRQDYNAVLVAVGAAQSIRRSALVSAISGRPDMLKSFGVKGERTDAGVVVKVKPGIFATTKEGVFAAGDATTGPTSVTQAIGSGRRAAGAIDRFLKGEKLTAVKQTARRPQRLTKGEIAGLNGRFPAAKRVTGHVSRGYTAEQAREEASRCLAGDVEGCIECRECETWCEAKAINHAMKDETVELDVGNIILTTGFQQFDPKPAYQFGYGRYPNVLTGMQFERLNHSGGPTGGNILMAGGRAPESVAILHCIGSRDVNYHEYCSRVCCMYSLKFAHLLREKLPNAEVYQMYIDLRCFGKGYEEFYNRIQEEGVNFIRGRAAEVTDFPEAPGEEGKLVVLCEDTLIGKKRRIPVDMVILSVALEPQADVADVARIFSISRSKDGFFLEKHPKLDPVATSTDGVMVAGCCQGPKDIPDTVAQASAAAARVLALISKGKVEIEAAVSVIDDKLCSGCQTCISLCPYKAICYEEPKKVSVINEALCKGCGTCAAGCPSGAIVARHFTTDEIMAQIEGILV